MKKDAQADIPYIYIAKNPGIYRNTLRSAFEKTFLQDKCKRHNQIAGEFSER